MIKNTLRKIAGIALSAAMIFSMGVTAFADTTPAGSYPTAVSITMKKDVMIYNTSGHIIDAPEIEYSYKVEAVTPAENTKITDYQGNSGSVKAGVAGVVSITEKVDFSAEEAKEAEAGHDYDAAGKKYAKDVVVSIDIAKIPAAGIYRYKLTDTTSAEALANAGIVRAEAYDPVRYLDVYVSNHEASLYISGTVLFRNGSDSISLSGEQLNGAVKVTGYDAASEPVSDQYHTYNLDITKTVDGAMGDKTYEFDFAVSTKDANAGAASTIFYAVDGGSESSALIGADIAAKLHHGQTLHLYGLPQTTLYNVTESAHKFDTYSVTVFDDADNLYKGENKADGSKGVNMAALTGSVKAAEADIALVKDYSANAAGTQVMASITFLNYLNAISPTGVALRVAPYAIMLAAGLFLLIFSRKFKAAAENN